MPKLESRLLNLGIQLRESVLRCHRGTEISVAISTNKQTIVSGGSDGTVRLWDNQGKQVAELRGHLG